MTSAPELAKTNAPPTPWTIRQRISVGARVGQARAERGEREQRQAGDVEALAAELVAEPPGGQQQHRAGDHVGEDHPDQAQQRDAQLALDVGQGDQEACRCSPWPGTGRGWSPRAPTTGTSGWSCATPTRRPRHLGAGATVGVDELMSGDTCILQVGPAPAQARSTSPRRSVRKPGVGEQGLERRPEHRLAVHALDRRAPPAVGQDPRRPGPAPRRARARSSVLGKVSRPARRAPGRAPARPSTSTTWAPNTRDGDRAPSRARPGHGGAVGLGRVGGAEHHDVRGSSSGGGVAQVAQPLDGARHRELGAAEALHEVAAPARCRASPGRRAPGRPPRSRPGTPSDRVAERVSTPWRSTSSSASGAAALVRRRRRRAKSRSASDQRPATADGARRAARPGAAAPRPRPAASAAGSRRGARRGSQRSLVTSPGPDQRPERGEDLLAGAPRPPPAGRPRSSRRRARAARSAVGHRALGRRVGGRRARAAGRPRGSRAPPGRRPRRRRPAPTHTISPRAASSSSAAGP